MIITIIFAVMLVLGIIALYMQNEDLDIIGLFLTTIGFIALFISLFLIFISHATINNYIQQNKIEYDGLCKRYEIIESEYEDVSKSDVIADITDWNKMVYSTKYWTENPWTNWFYPKEIADNLNYISMD